jgi:hypothetical protein
VAKRGRRANRFQLCGERNGEGIVLRHISLDEGKALVAKGSAIQIECGEGTIGFEMRRTRPGEALALVLERKKAAMEDLLKPSCAAFSRAEVEAIAGLRGRSRTIHLSEEKRAERIRHNWMAEDLVEQARKKLEVYPEIH